MNIGAGSGGDRRVEGLEARVMLIHGNADQVMPFQESEHAAAALSGLGVDVATHILPGVGHTISAQGAALAGAFLTEVFAKAGGAK